MLITLGSEGCILLEKQEGSTKSTHIAGRQVEVVDTVGAGDSFLGAFGFFLTQGLSIETSLQRANYVASISVTRFGTQSSFASRSELPADFFENA